MSAGKAQLREMTVLALLGAMMMATQVALAALPNIHLVAVFVILATLLFGWKALYSVYIFVILEGLIYGISMWFFNYLYIWTILALAAYAMRKLQHPIWWALLSGTFGMAFGLLCAPVDFLLGDLGYVVAKWVSGISFDVTHAIGNFVIALLAFVPLRKLLEKLYQKIRT